MSRLTLKTAAGATILVPALLLTACSTTDSADPAAASSASSAADSVTVDNCGVEVTYPADPSLWVHDSNIISIALSAGAGDAISAVSSINENRDILAAKYGAEVVDALDERSNQYPSIEQLVEIQPDIYVAGWNYGMSEASGVTPDTLAARGIRNYQLTEACRQEGTTQRGVVDPWVALETDLRNLGEIAGTASVAEEVIADHEQRLAALDTAPQPTEIPTLFVFDSGTDAIFTSGRFGAPQAIIEAAGGRNQTEGLDDTWVSVGWETLAEETPDAIVFVDYVGQSFEEKVEVLKNHPVTRDLPTVRENRFINLSYAMWTSSPLNIDAAEHVRKGLEGFGLVPESAIEPALALPASLPGQEYFIN